MPSNKTSLYDGSVFLNNLADTLDLSGWINRKSSQNYIAGAKRIILNLSVSTLVSVGDKLMKTKNNKLIGIVTKVDGTSVYFASEIKTPLETNDYVHVYPKFEIIRIDIIGENTYFASLVPVNTKQVGIESPDLSTYAQTAISDFGASKESGIVMHQGAQEMGTSIDGRFKYVTIDSTDPTSQVESVVCYLKATPTIM